MTFRSSITRAALRPLAVATPLLAAAAATGSPAAGRAPTAVAGDLQPAPVELPGEATIARVSREPGTWIVAGAPGRATAAAARRFGGRPIFPPAGVFEVPVRQARGLASALRGAGRLSFAEPNVLAAPAGFPADPLTPRQYWLPRVVHPSLTPPRASRRSPLLAIVDTQVDVSHPEFAGRNLTAASRGRPRYAHGTAVASIAGAAANGRGIVGVWPGMRMRGFASDGLETNTGAATCSATVRRLYEAIEAGAAVINMSYGFPHPGCFAHLTATQFAVGNQVVLVAAGGNDFGEGNYARRPAVDPHVVTVAATDRDDSSAYFSSENKAIDLAAPGVDILAAVPPGMDPDGHRDGYSLFSGTSFSAPMVAGAAAWVRALRPELTDDQVGQLLRDSARDLGERGWDQRFGWGMLDVRRALAIAPQRSDPLEPNDDIEWIDGRRFQADPPIATPENGRRSVSARMDELEDPADVYRFLVPPLRSVSFRLVLSSGDADLELFSSRAGTVRQRRERIAASRRRGRRTESLTVTNAGGRTVSVFAHARIVEGGSKLTAAYRLEAGRVAYRSSAPRAR